VAVIHFPTTLDTVSLAGCRRHHRRRRRRRRHRFPPCVSLAPDTPTTCTSPAPERFRYTTTARALNTCGCIRRHRQTLREHSEREIRPGN